MEIFGRKIFERNTKPFGKCCFRGECKGNLHEYDVRMVAKPDGTPVQDAPMEKTFICEGHYPDKTDPTFSLCRCRLCLERRK